MEEREVVGRRREVAWVAGAIGAGGLLVLVGIVSLADRADLSGTLGGVCTAGIFIAGALLVAYGLVGMGRDRVVVSSERVGYTDKLRHEDSVRWEDVAVVRIIDMARPLRLGFGFTQEAGRYSAIYLVGKDGRPLMNIQTPEDLDSDSFADVEDLVSEAARERGVDVVRREKAVRAPGGDQQA